MILINPSLYPSYSFFSEKRLIIRLSRMKYGGCQLEGSDLCRIVSLEDVRVELEVISNP